MNKLLLTVSFFDDRYHGLLERGGPPEWPPSPFRLFQALVAGVARRGELVDGDDICLCATCKDTRKSRGVDISGEPDSPSFKPIGQALGQLQRYTREHPPVIIAPKSKRGQAITRFGPNNDSDTERFRKEPEKCRASKPTIPTLFVLEEDQKSEVYYVWDITEWSDCPVDQIERAARSLTALGLGIDMAFADARRVNESDLQQLKGIRWHPKKNAGSFHDTLRVPTVGYDHTGNVVECTLCDLRHCHSTFINRIEHGKPLKTVDKPKVFERVLYTSIERPICRPCVMFKIECDDEVRRFAYDQSKLIHIAGMVRHLAIRAMGSRRLLERLYPGHDQGGDPFRDGNPPGDLRGRKWDEWVEQYVAGHKLPHDKANGKPHSQLAFVPLQSIGHEHADPAVRRVMIIAPVGDDAWIHHLARQLDGKQFKPLPNTRLPPGTRLELIDDDKKDGVRDAYLRPARTWASVTPVILPGHDDRKPEKTRKLIEKALTQSGIEQPCKFDWSAFSHFRKMLSAHKYVRDEKSEGGKRQIGYIRPDHLLDRTGVHLKLTFEHEIPGPITIGAGRHCGFGLFAAVDD
jgi:CRISPR-associated protein Csb2